MAIRLFAHTLMRSSTAANAGADPSLAFRPLDFGRRVLGELVMRRCEPIAWSLQQPLARPAPAPQREALGADSTWADTQPWWHE
jgi:hypothetical protein